MGTPNRLSIDILGVPVNDLSANEIIKTINACIQSRSKAVLAYVNIHAVNLAQDLPWFQNFMQRTSLNYCDGYGVMLGSWVLGKTIHHRASPPDWIETLVLECVSNRFSIFLLGGRVGIAKRTASILTYNFPGVQIVGTAHGYFDKHPGSSENEELICMINAAKPDLLLVGMGMPVQERWLLENLDHLDIKVALPVGALFEYLSGNILRPPRWMRGIGLEWLGRVAIEPKRLWKRYLYGIPRFLFIVLKARFME